MTTIRRGHFSEAGVLGHTIYRDGRAHLLLWEDGKSRIVNEYVVASRDITYRPIQSMYIEHGGVQVPSDSSFERHDDLIEDIRSYILGNILIDDSSSGVLTAYVMYTWLFDKVSAAPYLYIMGEQGRGKSRIKKLLSMLCFNGTDLGTSVTPPTLFRIQDMVRGTLHIDEFERDYSDKSDNYIQILNGGYTVGGVVYRNEQRGRGDWEPIPYVVGGPKVIVSRSIPGDMAMVSRCFAIPMDKVDKSLLDEKGISRHITPEMRTEAESIRNRLFGMRLKRYSEVPKLNASVRIDSEEPRDCELIESIVSVLPHDNQPVMAELLCAFLFRRDLIPSEKDEADLVLVLLTLTETNKNGLPLELKFSDIRTKAKDLTGHQFKPKEIGTTLRRLKFSTKRTAAGTVVVIRDLKLVTELVKKYDVCKPMQPSISKNE